MSSWSTEQLTEFLAAISSLPTADAALAAAAESAAEMFDTEVGAVVRGGVLASAVGLAGDEAAAGQLVRAARRELLEVELQGAGRCRVGVAELPNDGDDVLIVARAAGDSLAPDERSLLRGLARVLAIVLSNRELVELERRHAASLEEHQRLLEQLSRLQASISGEVGIQDVLDTILDGATKLLRTDIGALRLVDANDPSFSVAVSTMGTLDHGDRWMRRAPLTEGVSGHAISTGSIVLLDEYRAAVDVSRIAPVDMQAAIAAPLREHGEVVGSVLVGSRERGRRWSDAERDLLEVFAEHASLTLAASRKADHLRHAFTDSLTGLPNRALFLDRLDHHLVRAERDGVPVSVLFLDLDGFKLVNDTLGHLVGDRLLVAVAERLRECLRAAGTCSRPGGGGVAPPPPPGRQPGPRA